MCRGNICIVHHRLNKCWYVYIHLLMKHTHTHTQRTVWSVLEGRRIRNRTISCYELHLTKKAVSSDWLVGYSSMCSPWWWNLMWSKSLVHSKKAAVTPRSTYVCSLSLLRRLAVLWRSTKMRNKHIRGLYLTVTLDE